MCVQFVGYLSKLSENIHQLNREHSSVNINQFNKINIKCFLVHTIFHRLGNRPFSNQIMDDYVYLQDTYNKMSEKNKYIRTKFTKLVLFNNQ